MPLPDPAPVAKSTLASILTQLGLDPKLTIAVRIDNEAVTAQVVALDTNGVLIRSSGTEIVHTLVIPVQVP